MEIVDRLNGDQLQRTFKSLLRTVVGLLLFAGLKNSLHLNQSISFEILQYKSKLMTLNI